MKTGIAVSIIVLLLGNSAHAHHSHASLNTDDVRLFQGVVTKYSWRAPHVYIQANVAGPDGKIREYKVEILNPPAMTALGWSKETFKPGDRITWEGAHDQDVNRAYAGLSWAETADGTRLIATAAASRSAQMGQAAEQAGLEVEPVTEIGSGSWLRIAADGSRHPAIRTPASDWPLTPEAAEDVANWSEHDNPLNNCVYGGPPRNIISLSNYFWSRPDENTLVIDRDMWMEQRIIHLNSDAPRGEPSSFGHSVGRFEGNEFIIESDNFVAETWGMFTGIDSTEQKTLIERYWLSEGGQRLNVEFTVTDPGVLTEPYTYTHQWKRVPDRALAKAPCSLENAQAYRVDVESQVDDAAEVSVTEDAGAIEKERSLPRLPLFILAAVVIGVFGWRAFKK
jgi:hypothetical protein